MKEHSPLDLSSELIRMKLASTTLKRIERLQRKLQNFSDKDRLERAQAADIFWFSFMKDWLGLTIEEQLREVHRGPRGERVAGQIDERVLAFSQGTLNGIYLVKDFFEKQSEYLKARKQSEEVETPGEGFEPLGQFEA